jgi:SWI/SNF-related matrix-associated actin-dependent regulator of chromatin subfamily A member 5
MMTSFKGCEKYGRWAIAAIAGDIETKTEAEVREYAKVFWKRYKEIPGHYFFSTVFNFSLDTVKIIINIVSHPYVPNERTLWFCLYNVEYEKFIQNIERGEHKIARREEMIAALSHKVEQAQKDPFKNLKINYGGNKGKTYTEEEDIFLVNCFFQLE